MSEVGLFDQIIRLSPLILYGENGSGRTTFLVQLGRRLKQKGHRVLMFTSRASLRTLERLRDLGGIEVFVFDDLFSIDSRLDVLRRYVNSGRSNRRRLAILVDDFLPIRILVGPKTSEEASKLAKILFCLSSIARFFRIFTACVVGENTRTGLPHGVRLFIPYGFSMIRICRETRVRTIHIVSVDILDDKTVVSRKLIGRALMMSDGLRFYSTAGQDVGILS